MNISLSIFIYRSPEEVFPWIADPEKAVRWQKGVKRTAILHEEPGRVGTTFWEEMEEDGRTLEMTGRITSFEPDRSIAFHLESKLHTVDVSYTVEPEAHGSLLRVETEIRWKFPVSIMMFIIGAKAREGIITQTRAELDDLKRLCDGA